MKSIAVFILLLWTSFVAEQARPDLLPSGSMVIPVAVGCIFWLRSWQGMLLSGMALLLQWLVVPTPFPLTVAVILLLSARALTQQHRPDWDQTRIQRHAWWLQPTLIVIGGLICLDVSWARLVEFDTQHAVKALTERAVIAIPCVLLSAVITWLADEFGLRRRPA